MTPAELKAARETRGLPLADRAYALGNRHPMRAKLQALITYAGLSIGEAAIICGVGHDALSKKLRGVPRYDVRPAEIEALATLADAIDTAVAEQIAVIDAAGVERVALTLYRQDEDLMDDDAPFASVQRMIAARVARARPDSVLLVIFDRAEYDAWRGAKPDTRARRAEWAAGRVE